jgi:hypothetical protein
VLQKFLGADDSAVGRQQHLQHAELLAGQRDVQAPPPDAPPGPVDRQVPSLYHWRGRRTAPGQGTDPGYQFGERERLA